MTLSDFEIGVIPQQGEILFYHTGDPPVVKALNISDTSDSGTNVVSSLTQLTRIVLTISNVTYPLDVTSVTPYLGYYHVRVEDIAFSSSLFIPDGNGGFNLIDEVSANDTFLVPNLQTVGILKSDYNATENNAETNRTFSFIFDVDRSKYSGTTTRPVNYESIISGTATPAQFQELNYTSIGLSNSRHSGAKTSITDYGINSAINAQLLEGAVYLSSSLDSFICSQSLSDRDIVELLFDNPDSVPSNEETFYGVSPVSGSRIFTISGNQIIPLRNRKVWSKENTTIYYIDQNGFAINSGILCSN